MKKPKVKPLTDKQRVAKLERRIRTLELSLASMQSQICYLRGDVYELKWGPIG